MSKQTLQQWNQMVGNDPADPFSLTEYLARQRTWSRQTFGPSDRAKGIVDHIRKELNEIEQSPKDLSEWIDVVKLALDGAWRAGYSPVQIRDALIANTIKCEGRVWPDWRTMPQDKAIEHDRSHDSIDRPDAMEGVGV